MRLSPCRILIGALYKGSTKVEIRLFNNCLNDEYSDCKIIAIFIVGS